MTRYVIGVTVVILSGLIYWLSAGPQVLTKSKEIFSEETVYTWINTDEQPLPVPLAAAAKNNRFFCSSDQQSYGTISHTQDTIDVRWFNAQAQPIGSLNEVWQTDIALPKYFIDDAEQQLIAVDISNRLRIFNRSGILIYEFRLFENVDYSSENALFADFCAQSNLLFTGLTVASVPYSSKLKLISLDGNELWNKKFPEWRINTLFGTADSRLQIVSLYKSHLQEDWFKYQTLFFDQSGKQIGELPVQFKTASVDPGGTFVVLLDRQHAYVFDLKQNALISEFKTGNDQRLFHAAIFLDDTHLVLQEGDLSQIQQHWAYTNVELHTVSRQGKQIDVKRFPDITVFDPALSFNAESQMLFIGHSGGWQKFIVNL